MSKRRAAIFVVLMAVFVIAAPVFAADPDGAALYKSKCAMCHGPDGSGQTPMGKSVKLRDLHSADVQKLTDAELSKVISDSKGKMPPYKNKMSAAEINAVVAYLRPARK